MQKLTLNVSELEIDSFGIEQTASLAALPPTYNNTVLYNTQQVSCGGTCGTCGGTDCWA